MLSIIIIDSRPIVRFGIKYFLENSFKDLCLREFSSFQEFSLHIDPQIPDLVFLGGDLDQMLNIKKVKKIYARTKIIVYDTQGAAEIGLEYLRSGAQGYLPKTSDFTMFECCIKTVLKGNFYLDSMDIYTLLREFVFNHETSRKRIGSFLLTPRQNEIAQLFAQGMSTSGIARRLGLHSSTISTVKSIIYGKLEVNSVFELKEVLG